MTRRRWRGCVAPLLLAACTATAGPQQDLFRAARLGALVDIRASLEAGAGIDRRDPSYRQTALIRAAMFRQPDAVRALLQAGASAETAAWPDGMQALHWAALLNDSSTGLVLLQAGIGANVPDALGRTPLDYALTGGSAAMADLLLARGAEPERLLTPVADRIGMVLNPGTPAGEIEALLQVIRSGRGLEQGSGFEDASTALLALATRAHRPAAERFAAALVTAGANLAATDAKGRTPLTLVAEAAERQQNPAVRANLERVAGLLGGAGPE